MSFGYEVACFWVYMGGILRALLWIFGKVVILFVCGI